MLHCIQLISALINGLGCAVALIVSVTSLLPHSPGPSSLVVIIAVLCVVAAVVLFNCVNAAVVVILASCARAKVQVKDSIACLCAECVCLLCVLVTLLPCLQAVGHHEPWRMIARMPDSEVQPPHIADSFEIDPTEVVFNEEMGSIGDGNFGCVWSGTFRGQAVAIKAMKSM